MNLTLSALESSFSIKDYYIVCLLSVIISIVAVIISIAILILVWRTKPLLHTVRHLLMCNTAIASILYCIVQSTDYIYLIFLNWDTSDVSCRWRGYFSYVSICAVTYSYLNQTISRLFISLFSHKYRWLVTFKTHYILILIQWCIVIIIPLPAIITTDIHYRPTSLCWVPIKYLIHVIYTFVAYYLIPTLITCTIYIFIYYHIKKTANRAGTLIPRINTEKRDLELLRNITILLGIYLVGGIPTILFLITTNKLIYLMSIVTISLAVAVEKVFMSILDRDIRQVIKSLMLSKNRIVPIDFTITRGKCLVNQNYTQQNLNQHNEFKGLKY